MRFQPTSPATPPVFSNHFPSTDARPSSSIANCQDYSQSPQLYAERRRQSPKPAPLNAVPLAERQKRGRRSKSDAMLAIKSSTSSRASSTKAQKSEPQPGPSRNPLRNLAAQADAQSRPLDVRSIRIDAPRSTPPIPPSSRLFGLEHCPVFYPTADEFKDPMKYFESINSKLKAYGIGKIVPPVGWRPPCVLDSETFKFKTRLQRLNSMEASARASLNFLEQLYLFHKQQGTSGFVTSSSKIQVPNINHRPIDLWQVRKKVNALGGYEAITAHRKWSFLAKSLGYDVNRSPATAFQLKSAYLKILAPFEEYLARVKHQSPKRAQSPAGSLSPLTSPGAEDWAPDVEGPPTNLNYDDPSVSANPSSASRSAPPRDWEESIDRGGEICEICGSDEDDPNILLCDCCDKGYHLQCLTPALHAVPDGNWFCDACIVSTGNEFGFEEGHEHTLASFQLRADGFKKMWIEKHPVPKKELKLSGAQGSEWSEQAFQDELALEDHMEREFWRLVESPTENVEIEYGADIHSSTYGSGFPNVEKHPLEPYSRDGWNLNNLPIAPGSLLRYIKSDIAGMTQPWIYVGMVFSTFAWHKEDHYTYSVNYHHWGDTKTWYGVPGEDDEKLEAAMKVAAPELFEQQPDVMYQLVTLMSPGRLKSAGVRTYVCDQRPNEFVVTCPRSYHSGFNHGFNLNEAVNFCLPDWLSEGSLCVNHYKALHKLPVFSHDELLVTIFLNEKSPRVSRWLMSHFREMVTRELRDRENARKSIPNLAPEVIIEPADLAEDQIQCHHCKSLGYLSHVTSPGCPRVSCLEHSHTLGDGLKVLRFKYPDDVLEAMQLRVTSRSIKAGRIKNLAGVETRTSGRKRKPSTALLESSRVAIPSGQKLKLVHSWTDCAGGSSLDADPIITHESSIDCEADEKMEELSMDHEILQQAAHDGEAEEIKSEKADDQVDTWLKSINRGRLSAGPTIAMSALPVIPALGATRTRPQKKAQTVKLCEYASATELYCPPPPQRLDPEPVLETSVSQPATPAPKKRRSSNLSRSHTAGGKRRGRPPKSAELREAEAAAKLESKRLSISNRRASTQSTVARADELAQVDIEGSASAADLDEPIDKPIELHHSTQAYSLGPALSRKRGKRLKVEALALPPMTVLPPPDFASNPPNLFPRPSPNVIKIKPLRSVSQSVDPSLLSGNANHGSLPFKLPTDHPSSLNPRPQPVNPSAASPSYERPLSAPRSEMSTLHLPHHLPKAPVCEPRASTPSSLSSILNPAPSEHPHEGDLNQHLQVPHLSTEPSIPTHHIHYHPHSTPSASRLPSSRPGSAGQPYRTHSSPSSPHLTSTFSNAYQCHSHPHPPLVQGHEQSAHYPAYRHPHYPPGPNASASPIRPPSSSY